MVKKPKLRVLYIEDNQDDIVLLQHAFKKHNREFEIVPVSSRDDFENYFNNSKPDAIISDHGLIGYTGLDALEYVRNSDPIMPFMFLSGKLGEEEAVRLIMKGADDLVLKSNMKEVPKHLLKVIESARERREKFHFRKKLENQTNILNTLLQNSEDLIFLKDKNRKYILVNQAMCKHNRMEEKDMLNKTYSELFPHEIPDPSIESDIRVLEQSETIRYESNVIKDNKSIILETIKTPLINSEGIAEGIVGVSRDITKKKLQEEKIKRNEKLLNETEVLSQSGSFHYDASQDILTGSTNFLKLLGLENLTSTNLSSLSDRVFAADRKIFLDNLNESFKIKKPFMMEHRIQKPHSDSYFLCSTFVEYSGENGLFYGNIRNIEEERMNNDALLDIQENERKKLAAELHDSLTQKLVAANMYLRSMDANNLAFDRVCSAIELIQSGLNETRELTRSLSLHDLENLGLVQVLENVINSFPPEVKIHQEFDLDESKIGPAVAAALYRVIQESLTNIMKYAKASRVHVSIIAQEDHIDCQVKDNGKGFDVSQEILKGNGLKNIKQRIRSCNGIIKIESKPGKGTSILISVPFE